MTLYPLLSPDRGHGSSLHSRNNCHTRSDYPKTHITYQTPRPETPPEFNPQIPLQFRQIRRGPSPYRIQPNNPSQSPNLRRPLPRLYLKKILTTWSETPQSSPKRVTPKKSATTQEPHLEDQTHHALLCLQSDRFGPSCFR